MGYLGKTPSPAPLTSGDVPDLATSKITSGTFANARISAGSVTQHVTATDLTPVRQDVLTLALKQAVQENSTKFNLTNSAICKFEADADFNLAGSTTIVRSSDEYIWSGSETTGQARVSNSLEGNAVRSSADKKFDTHSLYCAADGDYWKSGVIYGVTGMPTTGDFTVDFFAKTTTTTGTNRLFSIGRNAQSGAECTLGAGYNASTTMNVIMGNPISNNDITGVVAEDTAWHHFAFQRSGTTLYLWVDGTYEGSFSNTESQVNLTGLHSAAHLMLGGTHHTGSEYHIGYIDNFRLSNVARYTNSTNFTAPSAAYTIANGGIDANTMLFMNFEDTNCNDSSLTTSTVSATATALGTTNVPSSAVTDVSGVMLLKNAFGTNTLGTDVKVYFTANNSAWTEATSYADAGTFSTGIKMIKLGKTTCTSGSDVRWKVVWANQSASSKEAYIYGIGLNY